MLRACAVCQALYEVVPGAGGSAAAAALAEAIDGSPPLPDRYCSKACRRHDHRHHPGR